MTFDVIYLLHVLQAFSSAIFRIQLCSKWQDFNRKRAWRGPSATSGPLVSYPACIWRPSWRWPQRNWTQIL